jgi:hypothetical protein
MAQLTAMPIPNQAAPADALPASWVTHLPPRLRPWLQLMRLDRPVGTWLLFWPCVMGLLLGATYLAVLVRISPWLLLAVAVMAGLITLVQKQLLPRIRAGSQTVAQTQVAISSRISDTVSGEDHSARTKDSPSPTEPPCTSLE